jgi:hypothetical protein
MNVVRVGWIQRFRWDEVLKGISLFALIAISPVWLYGNPDDLKGPITALSAGILALVAGILVFRRPHLIDRYGLYLTGALVLVDFFAFFETLPGGITISNVTGVAFEPGTLSSFVMISITLASGYFFARSHVNARRLLFLVVTAASLVAILFLVAVATGSLPLSGFFGELFSSELLFGFSFLCALSLIPSAPPHSFARKSSIAAAVLFLFALVFSHSELLAASVVCFAAALLFFLNRATGSQHSASAAAPAWICVFILLLFAVFNLQALVPQGLTQGFPTETRPSIQATAHVVFLPLARNPRAPFTGIGINSFGRAWAEYQPADVNATPLWDADFQTGSGFFLILLLMFGIPFTLLTVLVIGAASADRFAFFNFFPGRASPEGVAWLIPFLFSVFWMIFYVPNIAFFVLAFFAFGIALGMCNDAVAVPSESPHLRPWFVKGTSVVVGILLVVTGAVFLYLGAIRFLALREYESGAELFAAGTRYPDVENFMHASLAFEKLPLTERTLAAADEEEIRTILQEIPSRSLTLRSSARLATLRDESIASALQARILDPNDYHNWVEEGKARLLHAVSDQDAADALGALKDFKTAVALAPNDPLPLFFEGQAFYAMGDGENARKALISALILKPDYADAQHFMNRLEASSTTP